MDRIIKVRILKSQEYLDFIVDEDDFNLLSSINWYVNNNGYAINRKLGYLHRIIIKAKIGEITDHIDRNKLNCKKSNLRIVTHSLSIQNSGKRSKFNKYKGAHFNKISNKWMSSCSIEGVKINLGHYNNEISAAYAYNNYVKSKFPNAYLNTFDISEEEVLNIFNNDSDTINKVFYKDGLWGFKYLRLGILTKDEAENQLKILIENG